MTTTDSTQKWVQEMTEAFICPKDSQSRKNSAWCEPPEINMVERVIVCNFIPYAGPKLSEDVSYRLGKEINEDAKALSDSTSTLTKEKIYTRLAIINSLFSTNVEKGYFILQEMTDAIWEASKDTFGYYSDAALAYKAEDYIKQCLCSNQPDLSHHPIQLLLKTQFKWMKHAYTFQPQKEVSLLSKYLHYLLESAGSLIGFPIMDTLLKEGILKADRFNTTSQIGAFISKCLTRIPKYNYDFDIFPDYVRALDRIGYMLYVDSSAGWSRFHVLDRILWSVFKVADARDDAQIPQPSPNAPTYSISKLHLLMPQSTFDDILKCYNAKNPAFQKEFIMNSAELHETIQMNYPSVRMISEIMESIL